MVEQGGSWKRRVSRVAHGVAARTGPDPRLTRLTKELEAAQDETARARAEAATASSVDGEPRPVYGVTRYSVANPRGNQQWWALSAKNKGEDYTTKLWAADRMEPREHVFLNLATPIYQRFHDSYGYRHIVQYSPEMPARWVDALEDAARTYPVLLLLPGSRWQDRVTCIKNDIKARRCSPGPAAWLRVDDDDLLATTFLDQLVPKLVPAHDGYAVSFGRGLTAELDGLTLRNFGRTTRVMASMGQAFIGSVGEQSRVSWPPTTSHHRAHESMPTIVDSREVAYLRLIHENQDRKIANPDVKDPVDGHDVEDLGGELDRLFPTVRASAELPAPASEGSAAGADVPDGDA